MRDTILVRCFQNVGAPPSGEGAPGAPRQAACHNMRGTPGLAACALIEPCRRRREPPLRPYPLPQETYTPTARRYAHRAAFGL